MLNGQSTHSSVQSFIENQNNSASFLGEWSIFWPTREEEEYVNCIVKYIGTLIFTGVSK